MDKSKFKIKCVVYESNDYDKFKLMAKGNRVMGCVGCS